MELHHRCGVHACWNPDHLALTTHAGNQRHLRKPHCKHGHPLSGENLRIDPRSEARVCRSCARESQQQFRAAAKATKRSRTVGSSWKTKGRIGSNDRSRAVARSHHPRTNPSCTGNLLAVLRAGESLWSPRQGAGEVYTPAGLEVATRPDSRWHGAAPPMWHPCLLESGPPCSGHCRRGHPLSGANLPIDPRTGARICRACNAANQRAYANAERRRG